MKRTIRRRRLEAKTDYKTRLALLKSNKPRLVIRRTNRFITAQLVSSDIAQDRVLKTVSSKDLLTKGWPKESSGSLKGLQAAYLTGFLLGSLVKDSIEKEIILDIGMHRSVSRSRIFAALKGALDAGLKVPHDPEALPTPENFKQNEKLAPLIEKIKSEVQQ